MIEQIKRINLSFDEQLNTFEQEVNEVLETLVKPNWNKDLHGMVHVLYGFMMMSFSYIDLLSSLWDVKKNYRSQTIRMVDYMEKYFNYDREAINVSVKLWRHKLMHTAGPRLVQNKITNHKYYWLLHWGSPYLERTAHYVFQESGTKKILGLGLTYLVHDLRMSQNLLFSDLLNNSSKHIDLLHVYSELDGEIFKPV